MNQLHTVQQQYCQYRHRVDFTIHIIMPQPPSVRRWCCLTSVCLSCTSGLSREQRPRKTKIGTEVAHVTRDTNTTFKVKRSRSPGRFAHRVGASGGGSGGRGNVLAVGNCCYVAVCSAAQGASAPTGQEGRGHTVAAPAYSLFMLYSSVWKWIMTMVTILFACSFVDECRIIQKVVDRSV